MSTRHPNSSLIEPPKYLPPPPSSPPPRPRPPFHPPLQLTRNPPPIKIPLLRLHLLPIHIALPRRIRIKAQIPLNPLKPRRRILVRPYFVLDHFAARRVSDVVVGGRAFPFAEGGVGGREEGEEKGVRGEVVCWVGGVVR